MRAAYAVRRFIPAFLLLLRATRLAQDPQPDPFVFPCVLRPLAPSGPSRTLSACRSSRASTCTSRAPAATQPPVASCTGTVRCLPSFRRLPAAWRLVAHLTLPLAGPLTDAGVVALMYMRKQWVSRRHPSRGPRPARADPAVPSSAPAPNRLPDDCADLAEEPEHRQPNAVGPVR